MLSENAITVENLSKCYQIYDTPGKRLKQMLMRGHRNYYKEFWALRNISFSVGKGETVGIVGQNGCGKSTILQILCGVLHPTSGSRTINGRIAALLELGSGFNPEFTGRENVYMNGSVLGLTSEEIDQRFSAITNFANIGDFIEQPVKTYSSGMMVRLAFAVAINVEPEILIVDEALAVGDELFQRKCFAKIEEIKKKGATILFVSHSVGTVLELCDSAILLDRGELLATGSPKYITGRYQKLIYAPAERREEIRRKILEEDEPADEQESQETEEKTTLEVAADNEDEESFDPGLLPSSTVEYISKGVTICNPRICTLSGKRVNNLVSGRRYYYCYTVNVTQLVNNVSFGMMIKTVSGVELGGGTSSPTNKHSVTVAKPGSQWEVKFLFHCNLAPGVYFLNAGVTSNTGGEIDYLHRLLDIAMFRVLPDLERIATGTVDFGCQCKVTQK